MKKNRKALIFLAILTLALWPHVSAIAGSDDAANTGPILDSVAEEPVLTLRRQANFREEGVRSGTLIELYADRSLEISALGMLEDADEPVLIHAGSVTEKEYLTVEQLLGDSGFLNLPDWIETGVLDGDTVALTARTAEGVHTVSAYSPDGTPFGDIVEALESLLGAYESAEGE